MAASKFYIISGFNFALTILALLLLLVHSNDRDIVILRQWHAPTKIIMEDVMAAPMPNILVKKGERLDEFISNKFWEQVNKGNDTGALRMLRVMLNRNKKMQFKKCIELLSPAICNNSNTQPFFMWAKMAAQDLTKDGVAELKDKLLSHKLLSQHVNL